MVIILTMGLRKTMIILIEVLLTKARTIILVVPLMALRNDLLGRFSKAGIQPLL